MRGREGCHQGCGMGCSSAPQPGWQEGALQHPQASAARSPAPAPPVEFIVWPHRKKQEVVIYHTSSKRQNEQKGWRSDVVNLKSTRTHFILFYFNHLFFQTHGVKLQMPYKMHTLWNSCIAGNKEPSANPTATLTAGLPLTGARKIPYLNRNRAHPPSRGVLWQHIYILFRRKKKAFSWR